VQFTHFVIKTVAVFTWTRESKGNSAVEWKNVFCVLTALTGANWG